MNKLNQKIIDSLQSKHDAFLGNQGKDVSRAFKNGLMWAIDTIETLTHLDELDNYES